MKKIMLFNFILFSLLYFSCASTDTNKIANVKKEYNFIEIDSKDFTIPKAKENNWEALIINNAILINSGGVRILFTGGPTNDEAICFYLNAYTSNSDFKDGTGFNGMSEEISDIIYNKIHYGKPYYKIKVILN